MKTSALVLGLLLCGSARAVDFKIATQSATVENGRLRASFVVTNGESDHFRGNVRIRAFLLPATFPTNGSPHAQPVLLPSQEVAVTLHGDIAQVVELNFALPNVPAENYFVGAYVNSNVAIAEAQRMNNVTEDLFNVGRVVNDGVASAETQADDLYMDVPAVAVRPGYVGAAWRLFKRGTVDTTPNFYCLFLMANLAERKLFVSTYEKTTHWVNMGQDVDVAGRSVPYDVYANPVGFNHLKSGEYGVITWVDSREMLREADSSNNMNMRRTKISRAHLNSPSDGWFTSVGSAGALTRNVQLINDFTGPGAWSIDPASVPAGVTITPMSGTASQLESAISLAFNVDTGVFAEGVTEMALRVQINQGQNETLSVPIRVLRAEAQPMTAALNYSTALTVQKHDLATGFLELPNLLSQPVHYQVSSAAQGLYGLGTFVVPPGETRRVEFIADSRAILIGSSTVVLSVTSTGHAAAQSLPVALTVTARR